MSSEIHEASLDEIDTLPEPQPGDADKHILAIAHHPDEDTVELYMYRPEPQSIVFLKRELPFVIAALQGVEGTNHHEPR